MAVKGEADAYNANFDAFAGISYPVYPGQMPVYQRRGQQWRRQLLPGWGMRAGLPAPRLTRPTPQQRRMPAMAVYVRSMLPVLPDQ